MFGSATRRDFAIVIDDLRRRSGGDLLRLKPDEISAASSLLAPRLRHYLLPVLVDVAISDDSERLIAAVRAFGREMMPPARLVADWALSIGVDAQQLARTATSVAGPVLLVEECLKDGPIGLPQVTMLRDVAAAYGGDREAAGEWVKSAVDREIDRYASLAKRRASRSGLWQRLCAGFLNGEI
jgi:hypothetical protein